MKKRVFFALLVVAAVFTLTSCDREQSDTKNLLGTWTNTNDSYEITIAGANQIPESTIELTFERNRVYVTDARCNCLPQGYSYKLTRKDGELFIEIVGWLPKSKIMTLTSNSLVINDDLDSIDAGFSLVFQR